MFRSFSGFKSQYHGLTLVGVAEFNEWKVLVYGPGVTIHGARQFDETKAKEHVLVLAENYVRDEMHQEPSPPAEVRWETTSNHDWMVWRA